MWQYGQKWKVVLLKAKNKIKNLNNFEVIDIKLAAS